MTAAGSPIEPTVQEPPSGGAEKRLRVFGLDPRLVFAIMLVTLALPSIFFIQASYRQLGQILVSIQASPSAEVVALLAEEPAPDVALAAAFRDRARVALERDAMTNRQQRAGALLATRTWIYFMSLIFGAILVVIGAAFVLGRITAPMSEGAMKWGDVGASISTSPPGLFLVAFGCMPISLPIVRLGPDHRQRRLQLLPRRSAGGEASDRDAAIADIIREAAEKRGPGP